MEKEWPRSGKRSHCPHILLASTQRTVQYTDSHLLSKITRQSLTVLCWEPQGCISSASFSSQTLRVTQAGASQTLPQGLQFQGHRWEEGATSPLPIAQASLVCFVWHREETPILGVKAAFTIWELWDSEYVILPSVCPQFPLLFSGKKKNSAYLIGLLWRFNELI